MLKDFSLQIKLFPLLDKVMENEIIWFEEKNLHTYIYIYIYTLELDLVPYGQKKYVHIYMCINNKYTGLFIVNDMPIK